MKRKIALFLTIIVGLVAFMAMPTAAEEIMEVVEAEPVVEGKPDVAVTVDDVTPQDEDTRIAQIDEASAKQLIENGKAIYVDDFVMTTEIRMPASEQRKQVEAGLPVVTRNYYHSAALNEGFYVDTIIERQSVEGSYGKWIIGSIVKNSTGNRWGRYENQVQVNLTTRKFDRHLAESYACSHNSVSTFTRYSLDQKLTAENFRTKAYFYYINNGVSYIFGSTNTYAIESIGTAMPYLAGATYAPDVAI